MCKCGSEDIVMIQVGDETAYKCRDCGRIYFIKPEVEKEE